MESAGTAHGGERQFPAGDSKETARGKELLDECSYHLISLSTASKMHSIDGTQLTRSRT